MWKFGFDFKSCDMNGICPLIRSLMWTDERNKPDYRFFRFLINRGADPNVVAQGMITPLTMVFSTTFKEANQEIPVDVIYSLFQAGLDFSSMQIHELVVFSQFVYRFLIDVQLHVFQFLLTTIKNKQQARFQAKKPGALLLHL